MNEITKVGFDYEMIANKITRKEVKHHETEIKKCFTEAHCKLINAGIHLANVKNLLEHGLFMDWVNQVFGMEYRTAKRYMEVAENFPIIDNLSIMNFQKSALYALAAPSIPEEAREEAIEIAQAGEIVTHAKAKEIVAKHTPPKPELNQPSGRADDTDHTDTAFPEDPQIDAPPEVDGYGRPAQKFVEETHEVINPHLPDETPEVVTTLKDLSQAEEDALSPEEWLAMLPLYQKLIDEGMRLETFTNAALSWRKVRKTYQALRREVRACEGYNSPDMYAVKMRSAISMPHPKEWRFSRGAVGGFLL